MRKIFVSIIVVLICATSLSAQATKKEIKAYSVNYTATQQEAYMPSFDYDENAQIKNVILMIGDGMGLGAVNAALGANGGQLTMTNLQSIGLVRTQSADNFVTDSAASGTAYATGIKTNNGYVGVDPNGQAVQNLPEKLQPLGYACGVLTTDQLIEATPAAFFAHKASRTDNIGAWGDLVTCPLTFAAGGTSSAFEMLDLSLQNEIKKQFDVITMYDERAFAESKRLVYLPKEVIYEERGNYLPYTTELAIEFLSARSDKGFFLMVEGARIDKAAHKNSFEPEILETFDFDKAIEAAIRFAEKDGHTLVIITADHETGMLSTGNGDMESNFIAATYASRSHSSMMVPLFAYGPGSSKFVCVQENSDVSNKIFELLSKNVK